MKRIIICADDYAQNESTTHAILELIKDHRISAVSCMVMSDNWCSHGKKLREISDNIDVGLHFDLTHFTNINQFSLSKLIVACCLDKIDVQAVERSLNHQLDAFEVVMGRAPDYIDGHQHVHVLPNIRLCLLHVLKCRYGNKLPYLRQVNPTIVNGTALFKTIVLRLLASGFFSLATKHGFETTKHFFGVYSLKPLPYRSLFNAWLKQAPADSLIMCHPGFMSEDPLDPIKAIRIVEFDYLASDQFLQDLKNNNIKISQFNAK